MHILIASLYSITLWLSLLAYLLITESKGFIMALVTGPVIISGLIAALITLDMFIWFLLGLWRGRVRPPAE